MAYFDNAATTYPKPDCVYTAMDSFYRNHGGSAGRGEYELARSARGIIDETRTLLKELLHAPAKQVVFTPSATIALNMIIQGVILTGAKNVYISPFEHNAVTRTLHHMKAMDTIVVKELPVTRSLEFDLDRTRYMFDECRPDFVIVSHASNVIGLIAPVLSLFALSKEYGAVTLVDMAQTAGLVDLNVGLETIDFAVAAGHKTLLGPTGISAFLMKQGFALPPILFGGTGYDSANQDMPDSLPEKYEMGTLNTVGIAGLNASLKWIMEQSVEKLRVQEEAKRQRLIAVLQDYDFLKIVGNEPGRDYVGIVSCLMDGISSDSAGRLFTERGISVRTGLQCAPKAHQFLGTYPAGTIRFSVNCLTADDDFNELSDALNSIERDM